MLQLGRTKEPWKSRDAINRKLKIRKDYQFTLPLESFLSGPVLQDLRREYGKKAAEKATLEDCIVYWRRNRSKPHLSLSTISPFSHSLAVSFISFSKSASFSSKAFSVCTEHNNFSFQLVPSFSNASTYLRQSVACTTYAQEGEIRPCAL